ncbi:unnamed protein product [Psylliodes chrysocephalus]|uniref:Nbr1 FW domain-containing protein n=1 Tax=Psylliodes chrysocephalus TaxID=3402493 RepID=A0A9P0CH71_9CUCU|nr:unnamed protein product [Psylliodes chrysocephala]
MGSKKKDLEIIYSLQWKNKSGNGGDKANIIGMYDIPATTLNWEIFKSYLLKNSGTVGEDVKVSYITDSNREFPIESQTDFQIALYAFRRKARMGDIVNLKLDRISEPPQQSQRSSRHSNDVETQFDTEPVSIVSACCNSENPPEWFVSYMNKFKKSVSDEITSAVSSAVSTIKPHTVSQPPCYHRKSKSENSKRRKLPLLTGDGPHESTKDFIKSLKLDNKLEHKLEKLDKSKKSKDKKLTLFFKSSDSDVAVTSTVDKRRRSAPCESEDAVLQMDAAPVNTQQMVPHMLGGEVYLHQWKVINSGKSSWTNDTSLMFTWGSKALRALDTIVPVPHLKPGDTGTISVRLQIPNQPGLYECYFHFHHKGRRFGHWLGCQVVVDPFDLKGNKSVLETSYLPPFETASRNVSSTSDDLYNISNPVTRYEAIWEGTAATAGTGYTFNFDENTKDVDLLNKKTDLYDNQITRIPMDKVVRDLSSRVGDMKLQDPTDTNCSSDSDNQSIISLSESNSSKILTGIPSEYVVVPIPECFKLDEQSTLKSPENFKPDNNSEDLLKPSTSKVTVEDASLNKGADKKVESSDAADKEKSLENFDDNNNEDSKENAEKDKDVFQDAISTSNGFKSDIVMVTLPETNQDDEEYACVMVDGQKVMIPKKMIKSEYLRTPATSDNAVSASAKSRSGSSSPFAEVNVHYNETDGQSEVKIEQKVDAECEEVHEENDFSSHCSAAGSCFSDANAERSRLFIFPQACPGYEVIQGTDATELDDGLEYAWSKSESKNTLKSTISHPLIQDPLIPDPMPQISTSKTTGNNPFTSDNIPHVPNYQQTPPDERRAPSLDEIRAAFEANNETARMHTPEAVRSINTDSASRTESTPQPSAPASETHAEDSPRAPPSPPVHHILPESLVNGAVNAVSSVARSVINRIVPQGQPGRWVNGHWISNNPDSTREANLQALAEMGFWNRDLNATLLARYSDDLSRVVAELVQ